MQSVKLLERITARDPTSTRQKRTSPQLCDSKQHTDYNHCTSSTSPGQRSSGQSFSLNVATLQHKLLHITQVPTLDFLCQGVLQHDKCLQDYLQNLFPRFFLLFPLPLIYFITIILFSLI